MPSRQMPASFEDRVAREFNDELNAVAERVVQDAGPPPGAAKLSDAEAIRQWGIRDPFVDDTTPELLMTRGLPQAALQQTAFWQELDPDQQQAWGQVLTQPTQDAELADVLTRILETPYRFGLVTGWSDDPEEQAKRAEHLQRGWEKTWPDHLRAVTPATNEPTQGQAPPQPPMAGPMPQMPSQEAMP